MPLPPQFPDHPKRIGMYEDNGSNAGRGSHGAAINLQVDWDVPIKGSPLQSIKLGFMSLTDAEADVALRKQVFESHQAASLKHPTTWVDVGYVLDGDGITWYYQYDQPFIPAAQRAPQIWSNFYDSPNEPKVWTPAP